MGRASLQPVTAAAVLLTIAMIAPPSLSAAHAAGFKVPSGFVATEDSAPVAGAKQSPDWRPILTVRPEENAFSDLTSLSLREVVGKVGDPDEWLKQRLTIDVASDEEVEAVLDSPDSPFADPAFDVLRKAIPQLFESLRGLGKIGASLCEPPRSAYNAAGQLREMYCTFQMGPLRRYMLLRLQRVGETWYYTEIKTANERRLRELVAIADTFAG